MNNTKKRSFTALLCVLISALVLALSLGIFCACDGDKTADIENANEATWYYGDAEPAEGLGKEGDYYLNTETLASYVKEGKTWRAAADGEAGNWLTGDTAPTDGIGEVNDFYLDTDSGKLYHKSEGGWGSPVLILKGENGRDGVIWHSGAKDPEAGDSALTDALEGDFYLNTEKFTVWQLGADGEWASLGSIAGKGFQGFETKGNQLIVTFTDGTSQSFAFASCLGEHTFGEAEPMTIIEAGCTNRGLVIKTCTVCGSTIAEGIEPKGHQFVDGVCTVCGKSQLEGHYETNEEGQCEVTISPDLVEEGGDLTIASTVEGEEVTVKESISEESVQKRDSQFTQWTRGLNKAETNPNVNLHIGTLTIQEGVNVGPGAFAGATIEHLVLEGNASYGAYAFALVKGLKDVTIKGETTLNGYVFNGAELTSVDMSEATIEALPEGAFYGCTNLENVKLPETLKEIGHTAFYDCVFKVLVLPESLERLYSMAFYSCTNLEKLVFQSVIKKENRGMTPSGLAPSTTLTFYRAHVKVCFTGTLEEWIAGEPQDTNGMQDMIYNGDNKYSFSYEYSYQITPEDLGNA